MTVQALAGVVLAAAVQQAALGELMPPFPDTAERATITRWLTDVAGLPPEAPLDLGADSAVAVVTDTTTGLRTGVHSVSFREEAITADYVGRNGGRSKEGSGTVDCTERTVRSAGIAVYMGTGLKGERVANFLPEDIARRPAGGSLLERVMEAVCDARPAAAPAPAPSPAPPRPVAPATPLPSPAAAVRPAPVRPAPVPAPAPAPLPAPRAAVAPPAAPAQAAPARSGPVSVQVGAFASSEQAFAALDVAGAAAPEAIGGRSMEVQPARVGGREMFRALIGGFASRAEAQTFCQTLAAKGQACLVRP